MNDDFSGKCGTCRWWGISDAYVNEFGVRERIATHHANACQRHAPGPGKMNPNIDYSARAWPATKAEDWCGDFERYKRQRLGRMPVPKIIRYVKNPRDGWCA